MKKILYTSMIVLAGVFTSCDDILDTDSPSAMGESAIFSAEALANSAVMGIHQAFGETNSYRGRYLCYYGVNTDSEWFNNSYSKGSGDKEGSLCMYAATPDNQYMNTDNNAWAKLYESIERANKAIRGLRENKLYETNKNIGQLYGELLTLRAVVYYDLVKAWGDVPFRTEPVENSTINIPKTNRMVILDYLLNDLEEAAKYCYWPNENDYTKTTERVSKSFAKALRARIAMFCAGYSQYPDGIKRNTEDPNKYYTIAKNECVSIITQNCNPLGTFEENFKALCQDNVTAGKESLWEIPFSDGRGRVMYTYGVKHENTDKYTKQAKGGINGPLPTLFYDFDKEDVRRNITCVPYTWKGGIQVPAKVSAWCFGKLRYEWMNRIVTSSNDDGINFQFMRMADVYLLAAEAINELEGSPANAAQYLKPILDRSYPEAKATEILNAAKAGHDDFFEEIVRQRRFEFAGEQIRKVDLIRWNRLGSAMEAAKEEMKQLAERKGRFADLPKKIYYRTLTAADTPETGRTWDQTIAGETVEIYGLEIGDTDDAGTAKKWTSKEWLVTTNKTTKEEEPAMPVAQAEALYANDPDTKQFWPIWETFISKSNGVLTNDYGYGN